MPARALRTCAYNIDNKGRQEHGKKIEQATK